MWSIDTKGNKGAVFVLKSISGMGEGKVDITGFSGISMIWRGV
jgi:hypothetical protein